MKEQIILTETDFSKLKELVKKNKEKEIIFHSSDDELNRKVMEKLDVSGIMIKLDDRKDYMKQRNAGFNEVMAKIAKKNKIILYFDFDEILNSKNKEKVLARLKQNIFLCNKDNILIRFVFQKTKRDIYNVRSLMITLGLKTSLASKI